MKSSLRIFVLAMLALGFATSCQQKTKLPDVSQIKVDVKIERFDQEIAQLKEVDVAQKNKVWQAQYGDFYANFMQYMLEVGNPKDSIYVSTMLKQIIQQKDFKHLAEAVSKKFPNLQREEKDLTQAFKYVKYYFPAYKIPRFISFFSGFSVQAPLGEGYVGIGLDMFLGSDSEFYPALVRDIPMYISRRFTPENVVPRVVESVIRQDLFPQERTDLNTLQHMIYEGKVLLALDSILPTVSDSLKIGYTAEQLSWSKAYQEEIWSWFLQEELLYSTDYQRIQKYFTETPFTAELGENNESAPKLGMYIGWMIVRKYMERNPEVKLKDLLANADAQEILEKSKFKGK